MQIETSLYIIGTLGRPTKFFDVGGYLTENPIQACLYTSLKEAQDEKATLDESDKYVVYRVKCAITDEQVE